MRVNPRGTLRIIQFNVWKSAEKVMIDFMADEEVRDADILAIQEPWRNKYDGKGYNPSGGPFRLIEAGTENTRASIYINKRISTEDYGVIEVTPDLVSILLRLKIGGRTVETVIHSAYSPPPISHSVREIPEELAQTLRAIERQEEQILLGDFNLHHPTWGGQDSNRHVISADLIQATLENGFILILPRGTITRDIKKNLGRPNERVEKSTIDLAFTTATITNRVVSCMVRRDLRKGSDHLPIETTIALDEPAKSEPIRRRAWKRLNSDKFKDTFKQTINVLNGLKLDTAAEIDTYVGILIRGTQAAVEESTPLARTSRYDKNFWTSECTKAVAEASHLRWRAHNTNDPEDERRAQQATAHKGKILKKAKRAYFRRTMQEASQDQGKLWKLSKWAKRKAKGLLEPEYFGKLKKENVEAIRVEEKVGIFRRECFPPPPNADLEDLPGFRYPIQLTTSDEVSQDELAIAVWKTKPDKAPGPDELPNRIVKMITEQATTELVRLFTACLKHGYHPREFRKAITVMLKKPGKKDYTDPAAYRPIALLNTLGKILESIVAGRISDLAERWELLPDTQYGARPGRSTETALLNIYEQTRAAWARSKRAVVTILAMDVAKAFDRVSHARLVHNLRKRRIPQTLVNWVTSFLKGRQTSIRLGDYTSQLMDVQVGIPQGSPISPILYLFYNADMVDECTKARLTSNTTAFVDDNNILVYSDSTQSNCEKLQEVHLICKKWASQHGSQFNVDKYKMIHMARARRDDMQQSLVLDDQIIEPDDKLKILGVYLDRTLSGNAQVRATLDKAPKLLAAMRTLQGSNWGASLQASRQVYLGMVRPALTYGSLVWYRPEGILKGGRTTAKKLQAVQGQFLRTVAGAYKATSVEALEVETYVQPLDIHLTKLTLGAVARYTLSKARKGIEKRVTAILRGRGIRGRTPKYWGPFQTLQAWTTAISPQPLERQTSLDEEATREANGKLLNTVKAAIAANGRDCWKRRWETGIKGAHSRALQPRPNAKITQIHNGLKKHQSAITVQLRTGKIGLRAFLYRKRVPQIDSPFCLMCNELETVQHVLLRCPRWEEEREECIRTGLKGGTRPSLKVLLNTKKGCLAAARMVQRIELLPQFQSCDIEEVGEEVEQEEQEEEDEVLIRG